MMNQKEIKKNLRSLKYSETGEPLITEIMFHFYKTIELVNEAKEKEAIPSKDYEEIRKEFDNLEHKLIERGVIEED